MRHKTSYKLLTFYKFIDISDARDEVASHKSFCEDIGMKWRIYIGPEWISATMTCNTGQYEAYKLFVGQNKYFADLIPQIQDKATDEDGHKFDKMIVKYRDEIVSLGKKVTQDQIDHANRVLSVDDFKKIMDTEPDDRAILDMRNDYERQLGHFKNALPAGTVNFREVQDLINKYKEKLADKKVLMYCTWGIRCEKLSALLHEEWVDNFYGLDGGVVQYTNTYNDGNRLWNLYTFYGRVSCDIWDHNTHKTIAQCIYTDECTNNCENCRYSPCNARIIAKKSEFRAHFWFCSLACASAAASDILVKNADRDEMDYKTKRSQIKHDPASSQRMIKNVQEHISKHIQGIVYRHLEPQKETVLIER